MNNIQLRAILAKLHLRPDEAGLLLDVTERAVYLWLEGKRPVPRATALLLTAMAENVLPVGWLAAAMNRIPPRYRVKKFKPYTPISIFQP